MERPCLREGYQTSICSANSDPNEACRKFAVPHGILPKVVMRYGSTWRASHHFLVLFLLVCMMSMLLDACVFAVCDFTVSSEYQEIYDHCSVDKHEGNCIKSAHQPSVHDGHPPSFHKKFRASTCTFAGCIRSL